MLVIRPVQKSDNAALATIIRASLKEFGADKPGTVYFDETTDALFELFQQPQSVYWVATEHDEILGGCGVFPTAALPNGYAELVKLYLHSKARGRGIATQLMQHCFESAISSGFKHLYLESLPELLNAVSIYQKLGFEYLNKPLGESGHFGCSIWMEKSLL